MQDLLDESRYVDTVQIRLFYFQRNLMSDKLSCQITRALAAVFTFTSTKWYNQEYFDTNTELDGRLSMEFATVASYQQIVTAVLFAPCDHTSSKLTIPIPAL